MWIGGLSLLSTGETVPYLQLDFDAARARTNEDGQGEPVVHVTVEGDRVAFETVIGGKLLAFEGDRTADAVLEGRVLRGDASGTFRLDRTVPFERARFAKEAEGTYVNDTATLWLSARARKARLFDAMTGAFRACYPKADGSFLVGSGLSTAYPQTGLLRLVRDPSGAVTTIVVAEPGHPEQTVRRRDPHAEDIQLPADGATLAATLYLPAGTGPFPGVVFVHGSGRVTRDDWWQQAMARVYLREGVAVLLYDKRGTGASTGTYVGPGAADSDNTSPANLARLAADARVAAAALAARPEIDRRHVGLTGISQAGWIMPLAAARSKDVTFLVSFSGPAVTTYLEDVHSRMMGDGERAGGPKLEDVDEVVHRIPSAPPKTWRGGDPGFDPAPSLARMKIPALFFYGALDTSIPAAESVRVLDRLRQGHEWEVRTLPGAGHPLEEVTEDDEAADVRSPGMQRDLLPSLRAWLRAHVVGDRGGNPGTTTARAR